MTDDFPRPPLIYEGIDPVKQQQPLSAVVSETIKQAGSLTRQAFDASRRPGMPLSVLSNIAREAPLGTLLAAFLAGVVLARRR